MALTDELRINLPFNNDWLDKSGNGNNVTPSNIIFDDTNPKLGSHSAWGDGNDDDGEIADSPSLDVDYITVAVWFKHTTTGISILYERSDGTFGAGDWDLITINNKLRFQLHIGGLLREVNCSTIINDGNWHLGIFSYDGSYLRAFIDSIYEAETAASHGAMAATSDPLTLFARKGKVVPYPGSQDSFLMWGRSLTFGGVSVGNSATEELAEIWNNGNGIEIGAEEGIPLFSRARMVNL